MAFSSRRSVFRDHRLRPVEVVIQADLYDALALADIVQRLHGRQRVRQLSETMSEVRRLRANLSRGDTPAVRELIGVLKAAPEISVALDLPWPWGGERFELSDIRPLNLHRRPAW